MAYIKFSTKIKTFASIGGGAGSALGLAGLSSPNPWCLFVVNLFDFPGKML